MAFNEYIVDRVSFELSNRHIDFERKKMFGGICFMVDEKMCLGVSSEDLMVRLDPEDYNDSLKRLGCRPMDFTGRPMNGFVFVDPEGLDAESDFDHWVNLALEFNPKAKKSPKRKKSGN